MDFTIVWSDAAIAGSADRRLCSLRLFVNPRSKTRTTKAAVRATCSYVALDDPQAALRLGRGILVHVLESFPFIGPTYPRGSVVIRMLWIRGRKSPQSGNR
jgi:hypothetical protein